MLNTTANKSTKNLFANIEVLPSGQNISEKTTKGQCHKYKGQLILPMKTKGTLESTYLLNKLWFPARIIKAALIVGISAQKPGNKFFSVKFQTVTQIETNAKSENPLEI